MLVALENKKQVLFISPLVVLAHEHYIKTESRFRDLGYKVEVLTRLQSQRHATMVLKGLAAGTIDVVV
jgi:transcription-repair coupling factor (superfamily II helicase)